MTEPSPLPRFGIRHLLGLTAALAVASVLSRGTVLEAFNRDESIVMNDSSIAFRYAYSIGSILLVMSLSVNLLLVGCLLIWSWKIPGWKYQPGHFFAWAALFGCFSYALMKLMENASSSIVARSYYAVYFAVQIGASILPIFGALKSQHRRWKWVFIFFFFAISVGTPATILVGIIGQYGYPNIDFIMNYIMYGSYALIALVLLSLTSALAIDAWTWTPRHWSHWWAAIITLVSYWSSLVTLVLMLALRWTPAERSSPAIILLPPYT